MTGIGKRVGAVLLALLLVLGCLPEAMAAETTATTVQLAKTEGTVAVSNSRGRAVSLIEKMRLYSGYHLSTEEASYAWLELDSTKLCKLDAVSEMEVRKDGKKLELLLNEGNLFFNVTKPLDDDESLNIRTSTLVAGIRGTCGWVKAVDEWTSHLYVLEGAVEVAVSDPVTGETKSETVHAGEDAVCVVYPQDREGDKCEIVHGEIQESEIDGFVLTEAVPDEALCERIYDGSGLDLRDYPEDPEERLREDQSAVREQMAGIQEQVSLQENTVSTEPVWTEPEADAPSAGTAAPLSASELKPDTPSASDVPYTPSVPDYPDVYEPVYPPAPPVPPEPPVTPSPVTLTMPQEDDTVNDYLSQSAVSGVILQPGTSGELAVDSGLTVPAGKFLELQGGLGMTVRSGESLRVDGTLDVGGALENNGTVTVTSANTLRVRGDLANNGILIVTTTGRVVEDGYFGGSGTVAPAAGAVILAKHFDLDFMPPAGWQVSPAADNPGYYYTLIPSPETPSNVTWRIEGDTLYIEGSGPMDDYGYDQDPGPDPSVPPEVNTNPNPWQKEAFTKVVIAEGITGIGSNAFSNCKGLAEVTVPSTVQRIGFGAFHNCTALRSVALPAGVTDIGGEAFAGSGLRSAAIPSGVTSVDSGLFRHCASLESVTLPEGVTVIRNSAFYGCTSLKTINIPGSVTEIEGFAFMGCASLESVALPNGVTRIEPQTFSECTKLKSVTIPAGVTVIGKAAFSGCASLNGVKIPDGVTSIEPSAFNGCTSLTEAVIPDGVASIEASLFFGCTSLREVTVGVGVKSVGGHAFSNCVNLTSVEIPNGAATIGDAAFFGCAGLQSVKVPATVTGIGDNAFYGCNALADVYYGGTEAQWTNLLSTGTGINNAPLANAVIHYGASAEGNIDWSYSDDTLMISGTGAMEEYASYSNTPWKDKSFAAASLENGITHIGGNAFAGCTRLQKVTIGSDVASIGAGAFSGCTGLTSVTYAGTRAEWNALLPHIGENNSSLTGASIICMGDGGTVGEVQWRYSDGTLTIFGNGKMADYELAQSPFWNTGIIQKVVIEPGVTHIGKSAFDGCRNLTSVEIPNTVISIGGNAFYWCIGLGSVIIPESVTSIGGYAFFECNKNLTSVMIPASVTTIGDGAFARCLNLSSLTVVGGNGRYTTDENGVLYETDNAGQKTKLIAYPAAKPGTSYGIPDGVTTIGPYAFSGCASLTGLTVPKSVKNVGTRAFRECAGLKDVYYTGTQTEWNAITGLAEAWIPGSATIHYETDARTGVTWNYDEGTQTLTISGTGAMESIDGYRHDAIPWAAHIANIKTVNIETGVTSIGESAFSGCTSLTGVTIPSSVTVIGIRSFERCYGLTSVTIPNGVNSIEEFAFQNCTGLTTVNIPEGVTTVGVSAFNGCTAMTSVGIPSTLKSIGTQVFESCGLTSVTVPNTVTSIGNSAFRLCKDLTSVTIPHSVTSIGIDAFEGCTSLNNVVIPDTVTQIYASLFAGCTGLTTVTIPSTATSIGESAFLDCGLTSVTIPDTVTSIGKYAFSGCAGLTGVTIPSNVTEISEGAFRRCTGLTSMTIPDKVTHIRTDAFDGCTKLQSVTIPVSVTNIGSTAFRSCTGLEHVYYGGTQEQWEGISGYGNVPATATIHYNSTGTLSLSRASLHLSAGGAGAETEPGYTDVPEDAWYAEAAAYCRAHGLMTGTGDGVFSPDEPMTRAMAATVLYRLAGRPQASGTASFPDVEAGQWYTEAVSWAGGARIFRGYPDGAFGPDDPITHEQAALILQRYSGDPTVRITGGDMPDSPATRAEIAVALMGFAAGQTLAPGTLSVFSAMDLMCSPSGIVLDGDGSLLVTDVYHKQVWRVLHRASESYAGGATVQDLYGRPVGGYNDAGLDSSYFKEPWAIAPFLDGWAVSDAANNAVRLIQPGGVQTLNGTTREKLAVTELGVKFDHPTGLASDSEGNLYVSDTFGGAVRKVTPQGGVSTVVVDLSEPTGLCWKDGVLYIAETGRNRIVKVEGGQLSLLAGSGEAALTDGAAYGAAFNAPQGVAVGGDGSVYVADTGSGAIRRIKNGEVTTLAVRDPERMDGGLTSPIGLLVQGGRLYICDTFARKVFVYQLW